MATSNSPCGFAAVLQPIATLAQPATRRKSQRRYGRLSKIGGQRPKRRDFCWTLTCILVLAPFWLAWRGTAARSHQNLVWERTRHVLRLRSALREFYPAALQAFPELDAADALALLGKPPDPDPVPDGARLSRRAIAAAYARANRRDPAARAEKT